MNIRKGVIGFSVAIKILLLFLCTLIFLQSASAIAEEKEGGAETSEAAQVSAESSDEVEASKPKKKGTIVGGWINGPAECREIEDKEEKKACKAEIKEAKKKEREEKKQKLEGLILTQEKIVLLYRASIATIATAQAQIADAIGLKEQAELMRAEADALGADRGEFSKQSEKKKRRQLEGYTKLSKETNKAINERLAKHEELSEEDQKLFLDGVVTYAKGVVLSNEYLKEMGPFYRSLTEVVDLKAAANLERNDRAKLVEGAVKLLSTIKNLFNKKIRKLQTGVYLVFTFPKVFSDHSKTIHSLNQYASVNKIKVPKETQESLVTGIDLSDWQNL